MPKLTDISKILGKLTRSELKKFLSILTEALKQKKKVKPKMGKARKVKAGKK